MPQKINIQFDIEFQWNRYMQRMGMTREKLMRVPNQYTEIRKDFMGGLSQMFGLFLETADMTDDEASLFYDKIEKQLREWWQKELDDYNKKHGQ